VHSADAEERLSTAMFERRADTGPGKCPASSGCSVVASHLAGDHTIFVGEVHDAEVHEGDPLLYFRGEYRTIARHR